MLPYKHRNTSLSSRVIDIPLLLSSAGFGSTNVGLLFPTIIFLFALLAIVPIVNRLVLTIPDITLTRLSCGGSLTVLDMCIQSLLILVTIGPCLPRPRGQSASVYNIWPSRDTPLVIPLWISLTINIDCKSRNESGFSLVHMAVQNDPKRCAKPPRHTCTISSSSTVTLMEPNESWVSLI